MVLMFLEVTRAKRIENNFSGFKVKTGYERFFVVVLGNSTWGLQSASALQTTVLCYKRHLTNFLDFGQCYKRHLTNFLDFHQCYIRYLTNFLDSELYVLNAT